MGWSDLGCYGGEIETPNIDRLAAQGLRFRQFYNTAKCGPTRASLLTGLYWQKAGRNIKPDRLTFGQAMRTAGYATFAVGKWHLGGNPVDRGFDRYFGHLNGATNFFKGDDSFRLDKEKFDVPDEGFYTTDAFTDYAIEFLEEDDDPTRPFFLYLAYNAPHFPLHALPEDIAKYEQSYDAGWDAIRQQRFERLRTSGIADASWRLSPRDPIVEPWQSLTKTQREFLLPMMSVYAAMVDRMDQNIGRLVAHLRRQGKLENTLILFLSDNGACPYQRLRTPSIPPGPKESGIAYDARWAHLCNTPLRLYKQYAHEGGTATPMISHWPAGIQRPGSVVRATGHIVDLMPTVIELAEAEYPRRRNGQRVLPSEGVSLAGLLRGEPMPKRPPIYWEFKGHHAVRDGKWKLVAERSKDWELYDLSTDRCEMSNLATDDSHQVQRLAAMYDAWARRVGAKTHAQSRSLQPNRQSQLFDMTMLAPREE